MASAPEPAESPAGGAASSFEKLFSLLGDDEENNDSGEKHITAIDRCSSGHLQVPDEVGSRRMRKIMRGPYVTRSVNFLVLVNAVQMGVAADNKGADWDDIWLVFDNFFTLVFAVEMILQIVALKKYYFASAWCILDFLVANIGILDNWILPIFGLANSSLGAFRVFRLLRLLRLVKLMKIVPELMMVVEGIVASMKAMFWIFTLLMIILYIASICCVEVIGMERNDYPAWSDNPTVVEDEVVRDFNNYLYFGSVLRSMMSLFNLVLLDEWSALVRPVFEKQRVMLLFFVPLVMLCAFGVLNVIIGVVVERTTQAMNAVREEDVQKLKQKQTREVKALANIMFDLDEDQNNRISQAEFDKGAENPQLQTMLAVIGLPPGFTFRELFQTLDVDGSGWLSKAEFVDGVMRLIYNNSFQRECLLSCAIGQLKQGQYEMKHQISSLAADLRCDIEQLRGDLLGKSAIAESQKHNGTAAPSPTPVLPFSALSAQGAKLQDEADIKIDVDTSVLGPKPNLLGKTNSPNKSPLGAEDLDKSKSDWEPLQIMMMPKRLAALPEPSSCGVVDSDLNRALAGTSPPSTAELFNDNIIGFLPIVGSPQDRSPENGGQELSEAQESIQWLHLKLGRTPLSNERRSIRV